jgi:flagellin
MVINTNTSALSTASLLAKSSSALSASLSRLSSGSKITSPADDSAGLAVSMNLVAQEGENTAAASNVGNAISFNQTQDGYLQQVSSALDRMSELAVQAQDVTKSSSDLTLYNNEFSTLATYVNSVGTQSFNGVSLFNGLTLQVAVNSDGANPYANKGVELGAGTVYDMTSTGTNADLSTSTGALAALGFVTSAISQLATDRAKIGANEETLTDYSNQLSTLNNNLSAANSQIMDVDVAEESTNYAKENILVQTGTAMLAQANSLPQIALKLLQ